MDLLENLNIQDTSRKKVIKKRIVLRKVEKKKKIVKKKIIKKIVKSVVVPAIPKRKGWIPWRERFLIGKLNPDGKKYYAFFFKTRNNTFITITDVKGRVIVSQSAGSCKITTKKKKKSWDTLKAVAASASRIARMKNIRYIWKFFMTSTYMKNGKLIFRSFKESGLLILKGVIVRNRPHSLPMRKKKLKRL